jgi:methionine synthase I (cobalamin-dependent)
MNSFTSLLESSPTPLLADGAMGTLLHSRGAPFNHYFDEMNQSNLDFVSGIYAEYLNYSQNITAPAKAASIN